MIIWISGKSCVGKTLLAKKLLQKIKKKKIKIVHIDGDDIRKITHNFDYSGKGRYKNADFISKFVKLLNINKVNVVVSAISNFPKLLNWNRKNIKKYFQIFIKAENETLYKRDNKKIYFNKKVKNINVVGEDITFKAPRNSDLIIENNDNKNIFLKNVDFILNNKKIKFYL